MDATQYYIALFKHIFINTVIALFQNSAFNNILNLYKINLFERQRAFIVIYIYESIRVSVISQVDFKLFLLTGYQVSLAALKNIYQRK